MDYAAEITFVTSRQSVSQNCQFVNFSVAFEIGPQVFVIPRSRDLPYEQLDCICISHGNRCTVIHRRHVHSKVS